MRIKPIITTVFGVAIAAGSVFFAKEHLLVEQTATASASQSDLVEIYVARSEIAFGQTIEAHLVSVHLWPREAMPQGAFEDIASLVPAERNMLRRAKGRFYPGEVMLASKVSQFGEKVTLVQRLGKNTRAMAIKVDATTAVGGFVTPGDYVDIVMTQGAKQDLRAVTILQNIRVIGVDQQSEQTQDQPEVARTITVEVTAQEGQRLALGQKAGSLSLTLRTLEDVEDEPMEMVRLRDLLQEEGPAEQVLIQPTVKVRRGTNSEVVSITRRTVEEEETLDIEALPAGQPTSNPVAVPIQTETEQPVELETSLPVGAGVKPVARPLPADVIQPITVTQKIGE